MPEETDPLQPTEPVFANPFPDSAGVEIFGRALESARRPAGRAWKAPGLAEAARLLPEYEIIALLGSGGMGVVYRAKQRSLDRVVAIKLLPLEISSDQDFVDRFIREAQVLARFNHPNIVTVYASGRTAKNHFYFVMELVEGTNLAQIIHGPGLTEAQSLQIIARVCDAVHYAHGKGVIHRDIKPANIMVSTDGRVKVTDFGLARLHGGLAGDGQTATGNVMGTPEYMAPEQLRGTRVDHRADIYGLGVTLYEMLCRDVPRGVFGLPSANAGIDPRLDDVVLKAMQSQPDARYQSPAEMRADVEKVSSATWTRTLRNFWHRLGRWRLSGWTAAAAVLTGASGLL